jgi:hypothetical protein
MLVGLLLIVIKLKKNLNFLKLKYKHTQLNTPL